MHPDLRAGNKFHDLELPDHRGRPIKLSRLTAPTTYDTMLGFTDGYVRGYRDLGEEGLNVMEMVADPDGIMSDPALGRVLAWQLERLVALKSLSRELRGWRYNDRGFRRNHD